MIQRPQTLLLIGAAVVLLVSFFLPFWQFESETIQVSLSAFFRSMTVNGKTESQSIAHMAVVGIVAVVAIVFSVFKYQNRALQMKLVSVCNLLIGAHIVLFLFMVVPQAEDVIKQTGTLTIWAFLPLVAFVLNVVAKFLIKKDEDLVKSVDRIR